MTTRQVAGAFWTALIRFDAKDGWSRSSHITLSMLLALFPFTILALSLTRAVGKEGRAVNHLTSMSNRYSCYGFVTGVHGKFDN
jgi:uncharacterized BrkB/YihY/UPF0761 family membrane protein